MSNMAETVENLLLEYSNSLEYSFKERGRHADVDVGVDVAERDLFAVEGEEEIITILIIVPTEIRSTIMIVR